MTNQIEISNFIKQMMTSDPSLAKMSSGDNFGGMDIHDVKHVGQKIILPEGLDLSKAIKLLQKRKSYLEEETNFSEKFDCLPTDGAYALSQVLKKRFGFANAESFQVSGMFGPQTVKPETMSIEIGPNKREKVLWGRFPLNDDSGYIECGVYQKNRQYLFCLEGEIKRSSEDLVEGLCDEVRSFLAENSLYKGQAFKISFRNENGKVRQMPEVAFMDTSTIDPEMLVYSDEVMRSIDINLFTPIQRVKECVSNGISAKRGVLLGGNYGTGKTLAAHVASKYAVEQGLTFIYVAHAGELDLAVKFAMNYQNPACVIFCEDIDRSVSGERSVQMDDILNIVDGIDTKDAKIITVLTTNHLEDINPAMLRPGRLDAVIEVKEPDAKAVEKLIRRCGAELIADDTDLTEAGKILDGVIPAAITEVVKRAKLAELSKLPKNSLLVNISAESIVDAASSLQNQLRLLEPRNIQQKSLEDSFSELINKGVAQTLNGSKEKINEIHDSVV